MRQPRQLREGARYHVTARINRKETLLEYRSVRELFLSMVVRAKKKYRFRIWNFCLMDNHIHFLIEPAKGESLSAIMRWILGVFAMSYNKKNGLTGHVWGERFHSRILDGLRDFVLAFAYIDYNPVKAGLVAHPHEWRHGGLGHDREGCRSILDENPPWLRLLFPDHDLRCLS
jgi:putative transposase